jgi:hypothetical protein
LFLDLRKGDFPMALIQFGSFEIWSSSGSVTQEWNFSPRTAHGQISLGQADGGGLLDSGIRGYRNRPAGGAENVIDFGDNFYNWPNTVFDENLTSVTYALALGAHQEATGVCNLFTWRL